MRKTKLINKKNKKKSDRKCYFCGLDDYAVLDVHRIAEGQDGGKYTEFNSLTVCSNCHRKIHDKQIVIDRKYFATNGAYILHYWDEDGNEQWN